ncbi:glycoside hydrolase [Capsulimonas corticalis]|uniref:Glycoside hydrolase n=1 Tax=Capsulimonas corticalis TaxID=2219043 RepID=A0A402D350_9BACT|nr:glycoside hydrolase [Capsulimonas corticalis]BDI28501.1 glycoside hydrolase [Capsulimonas corticalis]
MRKNNVVSNTSIVTAMAALSLFACAPGAQAAGPDKTLAMDCYNNGFYNGNGTFYNTNTHTTGNQFWTYAEEIELMEDAAAVNSKYSSAVTALCNGFIAAYGTDWSGNTFNDDILWACIAFARSGNATFKSYAVNNFNKVWARAYDTNVISGLWWTTAKTSKNACVNGPGAIAAYLVGNTSAANTLWTGFLTNSRVCDLSKYRIADHINSDGTVGWAEFTYNQGTLIGAGVLLGHRAEAKMAMQETQNALCTNGILNVEGTGTNDAAGFKGVFARWAGKYAAGDTTFNAWLDANANQAWAERNSSGLVWSNWGARTSDGTVYSWECSSGASMIVNAP